MSDNHYAHCHGITVPITEADVDAIVRADLEKALFVTLEDGGILNVTAVQLISQHKLEPLAPKGTPRPR